MTQRVAATLGGINLRTGPEKNVVFYDRIVKALKRVPGMIKIEKIVGDGDAVTPDRAVDAATTLYDVVGDNHSGSCIKFKSLRLARQVGGVKNTVADD